MRSTKQLSITLPIEMAEMVRAKVTSGEYACESEVIRDGLRALSERNAAVERWLRNEVVPTARAHSANPGRASTVDEAFDRVISRLRARDQAAK